MMYFFKQKTAYEMRISDWSSDVCSSDLVPLHQRLVERDALQLPGAGGERVVRAVAVVVPARRSGQGGGLLAVAVEHRLTEGDEAVLHRPLRRIGLGHRPRRAGGRQDRDQDRKSTRLNSSH